MSEFFGRLLKLSKELQDRYEDHLRDNDELLAHVFMADITRFIVSQHRKILLEGSSPVSKQTLITILDLLEEGIKSEDQELNNVIALSFLENLDPNDIGYLDLKSYLKPALKHQLEQY